YQHRPSRKRPERRLGYEARRRPGQHDIDPGAGLDEQPQDLNRLVGGYPSAHAQHDLSIFEYTQHITYTRHIHGRRRPPRQPQNETLRVTRYVHDLWIYDPNPMRTKKAYAL